MNKKSLRSMNFLDQVTARDHPLRYFVENFVKNQERLAPKRKKTVDDVSQSGINFP